MNREPTPRRGRNVVEQPKACRADLTADPFDWFQTTFETLPPGEGKAIQRAALAQAG